MSVMDFIGGDLFTPVYGNEIPVIDTPSVDRICKELFFTIRSNKSIFIYGDYDMDGFCCQKVWQEVLSSLYNVPPVTFSYVSRTHILDTHIVGQLEKCDAKTVIICDTGSSEQDRLTLSLLRTKGYSPIVLDHHVWEGDYESDTRDMLVFNSYEERKIFGGHKISGAYTSLLVAKRLCSVYFSHSLSYNAMVYALASMYSDVVDLSSPIGRVLYNVVTMTKMPGPLLLSEMNKWDYSICRRFFSFILSPKFNACFRTERFDALNSSLSVVDKFGLKAVVMDLEKTHAYAADLTKKFIPLFERTKFGNITLCEHDLTSETQLLKIQNFTGVIANMITKEEKGAVVTIVNDGYSFSGSYRDYYDRKLLSTFQLFCDAAGHDCAFGLKFRDIHEYKRHLEVLSESVDSSSKRNYEVLSSNLLSSEDDIRILALYNEYMNVKPRYMIMHRCKGVRLLFSNKYRKEYEVGLPFPVISTFPLYDGMLAMVEPTISKRVELRCIE